MMTREDLRFIEEYCAEHKVSHKKCLRELKLSEYSFYKARRQYRAEDLSARPGEFIQLSPDRQISNKISAKRGVGRAVAGRNTVELPSQHGVSIEGCFLTVELMTKGGMSVRIQGGITPAYLKELISDGNV